MRECIIQESLENQKPGAFSSYRNSGRRRVLLLSACFLRLSPCALASASFIRMRCICRCSMRFATIGDNFSDGWRREGLLDRSCPLKSGEGVRTVRWKIPNNTHPVPILNDTHPFPSIYSVDALCRVRESVRFASERSRVRFPSSPPQRINPNLAPVGNGFGFIRIMKEVIP